MIGLNLTSKKLLLAGVLSFTVVSVIAADRYAVATGNWGSTSTWSATHGGASGATVPTASDIVYIDNGYTVTVVAASVCQSLQLGGTTSGYGNGTLAFGGAFTLTISGTVTIGNSAAGTTGSINMSNGTLACTGIIVNNGGTWTPGTGTVQLTAGNTLPASWLTTFYNLTVSGGTTTNNGSITISNALSGAGGLTQGVNATLIIGGTSTITTLTAANSGNTVNYSGGAQTVHSNNYYNLTLSGSGTKTLQAGTTAIGGNLTLSGTAAATTVAGLTVTGNLVIGDGTTFTAAGFALTVTGTTNVGAGTSGSLVISSATGTKVFTGLVTVASGATWNNSGNSPVTIRGGITSNGTFTAGTGVYTFDTNAQALSGTFSIPNVTVTGITLTNNNTLTAGTALAGTGGLTQAVNATLNIGGTSAITTLTAANSGNTVNYSGGAQTVHSNNYYNLTLSGSGTKTLQAGTTAIGGNLTLSGTAAATTVAGLTVTGNLVIGNGTTFTAAGFALTVTGTTNVGAGTSGSLVISSATGTKVFTGLVTVASGATWNNSGNSPVTIRGGITNNGTFTAGTGVYTFDTNAQALSGTFSIPNVTVTGITLTNNNTLTAGTALAGTGGLTQAVNAALNIGGTSAITTLTATNSGNTVNYTGAGQSLKATSYHNLTISGSNASMAGDIVVAGTLALTSGTFSVGANSLSLNGPAIAGTPANLTTTASSSLAFGGSSAGINIPSSVTNLRNLTINNSSGITLNSNLTLASNGILALTSGILQSGAFSLNVSNNSSAAIAFSAGSYINLTSGYLQRSLAGNLSGVGNNYLFPIGESNSYKAINLINVNTGLTGPVLRAAVASTGATTGDNISIGPLDPRCWSLINTNSGNFTSAGIELYESGLNATKTIGMSSAVPGVYSSIGGAAGGSSIISGTTLNPGSYFCIGTRIVTTYYSYKAGSWNDPETWTSDPSGTMQIGNTIPGGDARVFILSDRTVSLASDISSSGLDITVNQGGILNLSTYRFVNTLAALRGEGTIRLASVNFPAATINTFVNEGGGTTEYYNSSDFTFLSSQAIYNNLTINASGATATQLHNITINGNLYVMNGTYRINNNVATAKLSLTINGNVTVDNGAAITVGNGVTNTAIGGSGGAAPFLTYYLNFHTVIVKGDFTNNGTVKFTNLNYPVFNAFPPIVADPTSGAASVYFQGNSDNMLNCNGITIFYNLIINKGTDQTYKLTVNSTDYRNFRLYGANSLATDGVLTGNPNLRKALWIYTGTLVLKGSLIIPSLSEGTVANADYYIPANGGLILDGVDVVVLGTADDYREINVAYSVSAPDNATIGIGTGGYSAVDLFGKLQVNNGFLSTRESGGLITSSVSSGRFEFNGGTIDAKQFLSSSGSASYIQSGGLFILRGRFQRTPVAYSTIANLTDVSVATLNTSRIASGTSSGYGSFNLENTTNIYTVSGGTIRIYDVCGTAGAEQEAFDVKSSSSNFNVTGGTLEIIPLTGTGLADATNYRVYTTAPVYDLLINRQTSASVIGITAPLTIQNNFSLTAGAFSANNFNLTIGGNFTVEDGTAFATGNNSTILNGSADQILTNNLGTGLSFYNLSILKTADAGVRMAGTQGILTVTNNFNLTLGMFDDAGKTINIAGNVFNSGIHYGSGAIVLNGTNVQAISGGGTFRNLTLNNTNAASAPVSLASAITVKGVLAFSQDKLFNIGIYNLVLDSAASLSGAGSIRYIQTAGNAGDGGVTKVFATIDPFTFPVGAPTLIPVRTVKYTQATIGFSSAPSTFGRVTVIPVGYEHPATTVNGQSLTYFWRIISSGFSGINPNSVIHSFVYDESDVAGTETNYIPSLYDRSAYSWFSGLAANINTTTNTISDWSSPSNSRNFLDGDYTAGDASFGSPVKYYSRQSGVWSATSTWSLTSHTADNPPATPPGINDIVIIGDNDSIYLSNEVPPFPVNDNNPAATYYQLNKAVVSCANLQIEAGSVLDVQNNPGCYFGSVISHPNGNGKLRLTTRDAANFDNPEPFVYPSGDFSDFNAHSGITEFYSINPQQGTYFILPSNTSNYGTVILTPLRGSNLILPNLSNVTIQGDLICNGSDADAWLAMTWNGEYGTIVSKTVDVSGDLRVMGGSFGFIYNAATLQRINIAGDVYVNPGAGIDVWSSSTNNIMAISGNIYNNSDNSTAPYGTPSLIRFISGGSRCSVIFEGSNSSVVTNDPAISTTPVTTFNNVTINKGTNPDTTVTWNIGGTLTTQNDNWLTLQNGTLVYSRTGDFNISRATNFTIPETSGLIINTPSNVYIANSASNSRALFLYGRLTILNGGGNVYVGPAGNTANNADIEYSGSGNSFLDIRGGNMYVTGQIRRPVATTNGTLNYVQSGGNLIIYGNNSNAAKAKLEALNRSSFTMSGGTITIVRGGGTTFGDLYLRPETSSVTGGSIIFTQSPASGPVIDAVQSYSLDANFELNNLTLTGKTSGTNRTATLNLMVSPLVLKGSFTLSNNQSIFNSNNLNVSLEGDLNNNGTYNYGTNKTVFNGGIQSITGTSVTNFYDLEISAVTSLTVNGSFTVFHDLNIISGNLVLTSSLVTLLGHLTDNGAYSDDNSTGGITFNGAAQQIISGTGSYGRVVINNTAGVKLTNDISLQNNLVLTSGVLDINKYQLTLSQNSAVSGAPFSSSRMIISDGVTSSMGVMKYFNATPQSFTFPVGVTGKYTPASYNITAIGSVGSIRVNPVDEYNPSITDPSNALGFYWHIESSGISGLDASLLLQYLPSDVAGNESNYVAARLILPGGTWDKAPPGPATDNVNEATHQITFIHTLTNNLNGDYTAGSDSAIPDEVPTYQTNANGLWSNQSIWTPVGSSPPCPPGGPSGSLVIINHVVTVNTDFISVLNTTLNNELRILSPTFGHNLGYVDGNGKIYLESGNLPGGVYTEFFDCSGNGTIEYGGTGTYTVVASQLSSLPNLLFTGTGTRILPASDLTICKRLVVDGPLVDNSINNRKLVLNGTFERYNTGSFNSGSGNAPASTVTFEGTSAQSVGGPTGDFSGANKFNNLEINNTAGLSIGTNGLIEVNNQLLLTNGIITTTSANRLRLLSTSISSVSPDGGKSNSFVNGPLSKSITNGDSFLYPIGIGVVKSHNFTLTSTSGSTLPWTVLYTRPNPTATSLTPPLQVCNTLEFWSISSSVAATARVKIAWDPLSDLTPLMTLNGIGDMRVTEYNSGSWTELVSQTSGNAYYGDVETLNSISFSTTPKDYTTASISGTLARASLAPAGPVCGNAGIPVSFVSFNPINLNYTLSYTINDIPQTDLIVSGLPYTMPTPVPGIYRLTGFRFNNGTGIGIVDVTPITVYALPVTSNAGNDQSLCGVSSTTLAGNNPSPNSGRWTIISGAGGSFVNSVQYNTVFNGVLGTSYTLRWTISNGPCFSSDDVIISFPVVASTPGDFISAPPQVCQGTGGYVYTVPNVLGVTYTWSYSGTGHTINGTGNSVSVDFASNATSGTLSVTATNSCGTSGARTTDILVLTASFSYTGAPFCQNVANPLPSQGAGGLMGTFSSTPGLVFVNTLTGEINLAASYSGTYVVTNTVAAACGTLVSTSPVTISGQTWNGSAGSNWNIPGNWSCGFVPYPTTHVLIPDVANKPVLSGGITGTVNNLTIDPGSSLLVSGSTIRISGSVTSNGTFNASAGTVEMNGSSAQSIGAAVFTPNSVQNLTLNNPSGVTLLGPLNVTGIVYVQNGNLASDGNLTLASAASGTALINGSGSGSVTGNVTMQRYLSSAFGYKYFSSPFQSATVNEFGDDMDLTYWFPTFYSFDENSSNSGWIDYTSTSGALDPLHGYAVNFGSDPAARTVDVTGVVNNGSQSQIFYNHNNTYTVGFNLAGNPYPSPIDWDAPSGWTKTNIDDALYYFKAGTTDEFSGTYSSYVNKISSDGLATATIPSMQGFFIHVSDGAYPVTGTLGMDNSVRISDLTHGFMKSVQADDKAYLRISASYEDNTAAFDPAVFYFDDKASKDYDKNLDALKLMNTDYLTPSFYSVSEDGRNLSINAHPVPSYGRDRFPLGLRLDLDGMITFRINDMGENLTADKITILDKVTGHEQDLRNGGVYKVFLNSGEYTNRFFLNLSLTYTDTIDNPGDVDLFSVYSTHGRIIIRLMLYDEIPDNLLTISSITGQVLIIKKDLETGYHEFLSGLKDGIYIVTFTSGNSLISKKIMIKN